MSCSAWQLAHRVSICARNSCDSGGMMLCASWQSAHTGALPLDSPNTRLPWNEPRYMSKTSAWHSRQAPILAVASQPLRLLGVVRAGLEAEVATGAGELAVP